MPITSTVLYQGHLRTLATHAQSGSAIETDAPVDNAGRGERFSPTDLVATALASCMATVMGIVAERHGWNITGLQCEVEKIMVPSPRRIGEIRVELRFPVGRTYDAQTREILERTARTCPVLESLHPDCKKTLNFHWSSPDNSETNSAF
jgi:putative redox protein